MTLVNSYLKSNDPIVASKGADVITIGGRGGERENSAAPRVGGYPRAGENLIRSELGSSGRGPDVDAPNGVINNATQARHVIYLVNKTG